jgi:gliding motility-associated-like protein
MNKFIKILLLALVSILSVMISVDTQAQCTAVIGIIDVPQIAGDTVMGCDEFSIFFKEKTTGGVSTRLWNFGDGTPTNSGNNVLHKFPSGIKSDTIYTVNLTSTCLPSGSSSTTLKVKVLRRPNVSFTANNTTVCQQTGSVTFTNTSENKIGYTHDWDFGGETSSKNQNPTYSFQNDGLKTISLKVTDDRNCYRTVTKDDYINAVKLPNPDFAVDNQVVCNPNPVTFANTTTDLTLSTWLWDFGDGSPTVSAKDLASPHVYALAKTYSASLTAVNSLGCSNTTTKSIVSMFTPSAKFAIPATICKNETATLSYTGLANASSKYVWNFDNQITVQAGSKEGPYDLKFTAIGSKSIKLTITDTLSNCFDTLTKHVEVKEVPALSLASSEGDTICEASLVTFIASPAIYDKYVFKINKTVVQNSADYIYIAPLTLKNSDTVSVEIDNGCGGVENIPVVITVKELPEVTLKSSRDTIYKKTIITFTAVPKDLGGYERYDFYEGNVLKQTSASNVWVTDSLTDVKFVKVIAYNKGCNGNVSNKVIKVIDPFDSPDVVATSTTNSVTINWNKVLNSVGQSPDGYQISINGGPFIDPSSVYGPNGTSHVISGLSPGDTIRVTVKTLATKLNIADTLGNSVVNQTYTFFARECTAVNFSIGPDQSVCAGDSVKLFVKDVAIGNYSVRWNNTVTNQLTAYTFLPSQSQNTAIQIIDPLQPNCPFIKYTNVEVKTKPTVSLAVSPQGEIVKGDFMTFTASPGSNDWYTFYNKGLQVQKSSVNVYATKNYASGDVVTVDASLNGCTSDISNAIILKINASVAAVQINLDSATSSSVVLNWAPVEGATGYLVSVNGQSYVVPNGANINSLLNHAITGLSAGQKVDVIVKSFNSTDTTLSSVFTTYALACRGLEANLIGTPLVCSGDTAYVSISNVLPAYINTKWQNGIEGKNKTYKFMAYSSTNIQLELIDTERPGCNVTRQYEVKLNLASTCNKTDFSQIDQTQINLVSATNSSVAIKWNTVEGATGYLVSVNGNTYVIPNGTNSGTELTHIIAGLNPGDKVDVIVKAFNATDTTLSTVFATASESCRGVDLNLTGTSVVCTNDSATVQIATLIPSYYQTKWEGGVVGNAMSYQLKPLVTTNVKLELFDSERPGCYITRFFTVNVDPSVNCKSTQGNTEIVIKDKLKSPEVSIDNATNTSIKIAWVPVEGATSYIISVNGGSFVNYTGSVLPDSKGHLTYTDAGLTPGETVSFVVKAINGLDTVTSTIINGVATTCGPLEFSIDNSSPICAGDSAHLSISTVLPLDYTIKWDNQLDLTLRAYAFKPSVSTLVNVTVTNPAEPLCALTKKVFVKVNPIPVVTLTSSDVNDTIYSGAPISFTASPSGLDGYEFYERYALVQNSNLSVYNTNTLADNRKVSVIGISGGCRSASSDSILTKVKNPLSTIQLSVTSTSNSISIVWDKVVDAVRYEVSINGNPFTDPSSGNTADDTVHTITGLNPNETFTIVVKALTADPNGFGNSTSETWVQQTIICNGITFKVSADDTICAGSSNTKLLLSTNVAKYALRWNYTQPSTLTSYVFSPAETITIPVQLIDSSQINCPYYRNMKVTVNERKPLSIQASDASYQICKGDNFTINVQPSYLDNYLFKIKHPLISKLDTLQNNGNPKLLVKNFSAGDSIIVQGRLNACVALNDAKYAKIVNPIPSSLLGTNADPSACKGTDVLYSGIALNHKANYLFFEKGILAQASGNNSFIKTNVQTGVLNPITLVVKDLVTGCSSLLSAPKTITVLPYTEITASNAMSDAVCDGKPITFTISPSNLSKYQFLVNGVVMQEDVMNTYTVSSLKNGDKVNFVGIASNTCASPSIPEVTVTVKPVVQPDIEATTLEVCDGTLAQIKTIIPTGVSHTIDWNSGEVNVTEISKIYPVDTKVMVTVTTTNGGCKSSDSVLVKVDKATPPIAVIQQVGGNLSNGVSTVCKGEEIHLTGTGSSLGNYAWFDNKGQMIHANNVLDSLLESSANFTMVASNMACRDTAAIAIHIVNCTDKTAEIITPDGDGKNDGWVALNPEEYFKENTVTIFNRWGNEVYSTNNYKNDWNGTNNDGQKLPEGTYYYVIKIEGVAKPAGFVMIKR